MPGIPLERRLRQTQFTKREILDIVNDTSKTNPHEGSLGYRRAYSDFLAREKKLKILMFGKEIREYEFLDEHTLRWKYFADWREEYYECFEAAPGVYLFYHDQKKFAPPAMTAMALDFNTGAVTINMAQIGHEDYTPRDVSNRMVFGAMVKGDVIPTARHAFTDDFVGKVAAWKVGPEIWLTHHYINPRFFLNEIFGYGDAGVFLTIAEPAQYVKLAENLYVFSWREMAGPGIMGMDIMDWNKMQSVGFFYGINEADKYECYSFSRWAGKWLTVEDRKKSHREGLMSVVQGL